MYKNLIESSSVTNRSAIEISEKHIEACFPSPFVEFVLKQNGAKFKNAEIKSKYSKFNQSSYGIREFLTLEEISDLEVEYWDDNLVAFAEDSSGNFFVFKKTEMAKVYF